MEKQQQNLMWRFYLIVLLMFFFALGIGTKIFVIQWIEGPAFEAARAVHGQGHPAGGSEGSEGGACEHGQRRQGGCGSQPAPLRHCQVHPSPAPGDGGCYVRPRLSVQIAGGEGFPR